jgi:hypothetical protein
MESGYEEIIVPVLPKPDDNNFTINYFLNKSSVAYYRGYSESKDDKKAIMITALYLKGSEKMIRVKMSPTEFQYKLKENQINLSGLDLDQIDLIKRLIDSYSKENKDRYEKTKGTN